MIPKSDRQFLDKIMFIKNKRQKLLASHKSKLNIRGIES
ncbi:hypothetical protein CEV31_1224 [Brucella thiophenivorans]|uniref:Uncharacterized protein n=1 Tax=Brucella thiophenivorans TaxID=571255 RepID=A0A256FYE8_9HYPH|nr:hypothetical protein CEV31_1224 [Brucella thiophenivorans]